MTVYPDVEYLSPLTADEAGVLGAKLRDAYQRALREANSRWYANMEDPLWRLCSRAAIELEPLQADALNYQYQARWGLPLSDADARRRRVPGTVTAILSCTHMTQVPEGTVFPDVAMCPRSGLEREITGIWEERAALSHLREYDGLLISADTDM